VFKKLLAQVAVILIMALGVSVVQADEIEIDTGTDTQLEDDYPWRDHAEPFVFTFHNMIDTHQQSFLDRNGVLHGFIYIHFTGEYTEEGVPIARKANCDIEACSVGWVIKGVPYRATLVNKGPRVWQIDPACLPQEPGYTHFHWTGSPYKPHGLVLGPPTLYDGYLLKRVAVTTFYWLGGSGGGQGGDGGDGGSGNCGGDDGGCTGDDHTDGGCTGGGSDMGGSDMGGDCSGDDHTDGGCSGSSGSSGHAGRLVLEGFDPHSNISLDGTWRGCGSDD